MDDHEEMYYYGGAAPNDETDRYDEVLRSRPAGSQAESEAHWWPRLLQDNNFPFVVGIFCIGLFQFQGNYFWQHAVRLYASIKSWWLTHRWISTSNNSAAPVRRWIRDRVTILRAGDSEIGVGRLVLDLALFLLATGLDYTRAAYQILVNLLRSLWQLAPVIISEERGEMRDRDRRNRCNSLPELEDCAAIQLRQSDGIYRTENNPPPFPQPQSQIEAWEWGPVPRELEPAFLDERQYPKSWMVYHPVLRVVTREEAQKYDREQAEKRQQQQLQRQESKESCMSTRLEEFEEEKKDDTSGSNSFEATIGEVRPEDESKTITFGSSPKRQTNNSTSRQQQQQQPQRERSPSGGRSIPVLRSVVAT